MTYAKSKLASGISAAILLATGATTTVLSTDAAGAELPPGEILRKTQANYASFASYSDEGRVVKTMNDAAVTTRFTIRLARTNFYRIEWKRESKPSPYVNDSSPQAVWSSGAGDYLDVGYGPRNEDARDFALAQASAYSGGAAATIPVTFFNLQPEDELDGLAVGENQQADEKLGDVECYVFTKESGGQTRTLWIGKQDFLIHQLRTVTSAEAVQAMLAGARVGRELVDALGKSGSLAFTSTETHTNIVVNKRFVRSDFVPSFTSFSSLDSE